MRTQTIRISDKDGASATLLELHRFGGVVVGSDGSPASEAWVALVETGSLAVTDTDGRFRFDRLRAGSYHVRARGREGDEAETEVTLPGGTVDLVLASAKAGSKRRG